jgi:hypothetical protein
MAFATTLRYLIPRNSLYEILVRTQTGSVSFPLAKRVKPKQPFKRKMKISEFKDHSNFIMMSFDLAFSKSGSISIGLTVYDLKKYHEAVSSRTDLKVLMEPKVQPCGGFLAEYKTKRN